MEVEKYHIVIGNATDVGRIRKKNEDYLAHFDTGLGYCIIVCDGMGGHAAGNIAAQHAVEAIKHYLQKGENAKAGIAIALKNAFEFANFRLHEMAEQNPEWSGMGTTCVLAMISIEQLHVAHAGDSRLYLLRDNEITQITKDHSVVQNLVDAGLLTEEEAFVSDKRNQITKAIGSFEKVDPSVTEEAIPLLPGDRILLCTDGLTGHLKNKEIRDVISHCADVQPAAIKLVDKANKAGGTDNITVQLIGYLGTDPVQKKKRSKTGLLIIIISVLVLAIAAAILGFSGFLSPK